MKIALLFPGYGSQFVGMGKELYDKHRIVQEYFEEAANCLDTNFVKLCFASSDVELGRIEHAYPALFLVSSAIAALLKETGVKPDVVAGFGVGQYAAVHTAGGFTFPDGLYLLAKYAQFYKELLEKISVNALEINGVETEQLKDACLKASHGDDAVSIAAYRRADQHIVVGTYDALERLRELIGSIKKVKINEIPIEVGLHNSLMDPAIQNFKIYLEKVDFKDLSMPLITNADARLISEGDLVKSALVKQMSSAIAWHDIMQSLAPYDLFIAVSPSKKLEADLKKLYPDKEVLKINTQDDFEVIKKRFEPKEEPKKEIELEQPDSETKENDV